VPIVRRSITDGFFGRQADSRLQKLAHTSPAGTKSKVQHLFIPVFHSFKSYALGGMPSHETNPTEK